jgi:hypothetical protein
VAVGMLSDGWQARIENCYFDDSPLIVTFPWAHTVSGNLFFGMSALIFAPQAQGVQPQGLLFTGNVFSSTSYSGAGPAMHYVVANGTINASAMLQVVVADNVVADSAQERATKVSAAVLLSGGPGEWANATVDFRPALLFWDGEATEKGFIPLGEHGRPWDWRAAAAPALERISSDAGKRALGQRPDSMAATVSPSSPSSSVVWGGAFAQVRATASLVSGSAGGAAPVVALSPVAGTPGVVAVSVGLVGPGSAALGAWTVQVNLEADQAQPTQGVLVAAADAGGQRAEGGLRFVARLRG